MYIVSMYLYLLSVISQHAHRVGGVSSRGGGGVTPGGMLIHGLGGLIKGSDFRECPCLRISTGSGQLPDGPTPDISEKSLAPKVEPAGCYETLLYM